MIINHRFGNVFVTRSDEARANHTGRIAAHTHIAHNR